LLIILIPHADTYASTLDAFTKTLFALLLSFYLYRSLDVKQRPFVKVRWYHQPIEYNNRLTNYSRLISP